MYFQASGRVNLNMSFEWPQKVHFHYPCQHQWAALVIRERGVVEGGQGVQQKQHSAYTLSDPGRVEAAAQWVLRFQGTDRTLSLQATVILWELEKKNSIVLKPKLYFLSALE